MGRPPSPPVVLPVLACVAVACIFSGYFILVGRVLRGLALSPLVFALLRDAGGTALLLGAAWVAEGRKPEGDRRFWPQAVHAGPLFAAGLCGVWGAQGMSALALAHSEPGWCEVD